jgi:hypothetical protein
MNPCFPDSLKIEKTTPTRDLKTNKNKRASRPPTTGENPGRTGLFRGISRGRFRVVPPVKKISYLRDEAGGCESVGG